MIFLLLFLYLRNETGCEFSFSLLLHIIIPNDGKNDGSDHIHDQILHRIMNPNIQISAKASASCEPSEWTMITSAISLTGIAILSFVASSITVLKL